MKGNFRTFPDRQYTIRNTIEWSFDLLDPKEQNLLLQISLYHAGALLKTLEAFADLGDELYETLDGLINKSLLIKQDEEFNVRFQMLETVREFSFEKITSQGNMEQMRQIQADYYHASLKDMRLQKNKIDQVELLKCLEIEHTNIRLALDFLMHKKELRKVTDIAWSLWLFWWVNAHTKEVTPGSKSLGSVPQRKAII